eukprot:3720064-Rhodomonas_salina.2
MAARPPLMVVLTRGVYQPLWQQQCPHATRIPVARLVLTWRMALCVAAYWLVWRPTEPYKPPGLLAAYALSGTELAYAPRRRRQWWMGTGSTAKTVAPYARAKQCPVLTSCMVVAMLCMPGTTLVYGGSSLLRACYAMSGDSITVTTVHAVQTPYQPTPGPNHPSPSGPVPTQPQPPPARPYGSPAAPQPPPARPYGSPAAPQPPPDRPYGSPAAPQYQNQGGPQYENQGRGQYQNQAAPQYPNPSAMAPPRTTNANPPPRAAYMQTQVGRAYSEWR